jgi:hypothetical protein
VCGAFIAMSFIEGNPYPPLYEGLTLALVLIVRCRLGLTIRLLIALALAAVFAAGLGAIKYTPALLGRGKVTLERWSPNRLEYTVDAAEPSVLVINQNYDRSWRVVSGPGDTFSQNGLLAVHVPAGKSRTILRYISTEAI